MESYIDFKDKDDYRYGYIGEGSGGKVIQLVSYNEYNAEIVASPVIYDANHVAQSHPTLPDTRVKVSLDPNNRIVLMPHGNISLYDTRIDLLGRVGIGRGGANTPLTEKLEVAGKIKSTAAIFTNLPVYGSDADADADANLPSGSLYKRSDMGRQVFVKP